MSNFTTEVRFICESLNGVSSEGYSGLENILNVAAPLVFDFDFPIYDESYRLVLEKKILRHYYTREIAEETVGLWKLRLDARMNDIMPYYNQLYESTLIKYNPLYNVDYNYIADENKNRDSFENRNEKSNQYSAHAGKDSNVTSGNETSNDNYNEFENSNKNRQFNENKNENRTHTTTTNTEQASGTDTETNNPLKYTKSKSDSGFSNENNDVKDETNGNSTSTETTTEGRMDKANDTPQLGLNITDVEHDMYLSAIQTSDGNRNSSNTGESSQSKVTNSSKENSYKNNVTESLDYEVPESKTMQYGKLITKVDNFKDDNKGNIVSDESFDENRNNKGSSEKVNDFNKKSDNEFSNQASSTREVKNKSDYKVKDTNNYIKRVFGKNYSVTPAKMIKEFRETFLNIDMMIIDELADLFFGLWE